MIAKIKQENLLFSLYTGGFYLGWVGYLSRGQFILNGAHNVLQSLSFLCLTICAILLWYNRKKYIPNLVMTNFKIIGLFAVAVMMGIAAFPRLYSFSSYFMGAVVRDLTVFAYIACGPVLGMFSMRQRKAFAIIFVFFLITAVYLSTFINVNLAAATESRKFVYEELGSSNLYAYQIGIGGTAALLLLYVIATSRSLFGVVVYGAGTLYGLYTSLILSKRQGLGEFIIILLVLICYVVLQKGQTRMRLYLSIAFGIFVVAAGVVTTQSEFPKVFVERLVDRFSHLSYMGVEGFDRFVEASAYLQEAGFIEKIIGRGWGSFSMNVISGFVIHVGWVNLIFKGGIILAAFYMVTFVWNIAYVLLNKFFPSKIIALFFPCFCAFQLVYAPVWGFIPSVFWLGFAFFAPEIFLMSERVRAKEFAGMRRIAPPPIAGTGRPHLGYR